MRSRLLIAATLVLAACGRRDDATRAAAAAADDDATPSPVFRNVAARVAYVGDSACAGCHAKETAAYAGNSMAQSFHPWTATGKVERTLDSLVDRRTGFRYGVVEEQGRLWQVEYIPGAGGKRLHELRRRVDYVVGSGRLARTYFTDENGRMFQLPLTWYASHGWDFSPGYELGNERFSRQLPDRCVACHASYPVANAHLEGKYARLNPGIGCERCHGPGALHVAERTKAPKATTAAGAWDSTIVNPAHLPVARRVDICEQCHVHTAVAVPREGKGAFDFVPSERLSDQWAYFKAAGTIDVVSHADRLRQSRCFLETQRTSRPLECATCHDPHAPPATNAVAQKNAPCLSCHATAPLQQRVARDVRVAHAPTQDCTSCHMPKIRERTVPHGTFTEHWIRARPEAPEATPASAPNANGGVVPYFARDRAGPEAAIYQGMGAVLAATLDNDARALAEAASRLDEALAGDTTRADALFMLGAAWQQLGQAPQAISALERSLHARPDRPEALRALARAYAAAGRPDTAIAPLYERALALQPALAWIRAEYADLLQSRGERDATARAVATYRAALAEQPSLATGWFNLGTALVAQGKRTESEDAFRRAVVLDPELGQAVGTLVAMKVQGGTVAGVTALGSPLATLAVRDRGPRALRVEPTPDGAGLVLANVPPFGTVQVIASDGTTLRTIAAGAQPVVPWDLRVDGGAPIGAGLYRLRVLGKDQFGRPRPPQLVGIGIVRMPAGALATRADR